jgi:hypothetical protein
MIDDIWRFFSDLRVFSGSSDQLVLPQSSHRQQF